MLDGLGLAEWVFLAAVAVLLAVLAIGILVVFRRPKQTVTSPSIAQLELEEARREAAELRNRAEQESAEIRRQAEAAADHAVQTRDEADAEARTVKDEMRELRLDMERSEHRLAEREERLDAEQHRLEQRDRELDAVEAEIARKKAELADVEEERRLILERIAGMTAADAKAELVRVIENQAKREAAVIVRDIENEARTPARSGPARSSRWRSSGWPASRPRRASSSVLHLPSDDMKGRIIGREGRNIRAFESVTGVNLIIDDTPEAVLLSCFDPVRREVGRLTLEKLVLDGRIHPHRIEEMYERSKAEVRPLVRPGRGGRPGRGRHHATCTRS